jgi:hypothetical protein
MPSLIHDHVERRKITSEFSHYTKASNVKGGSRVGEG